MASHDHPAPTTPTVLVEEGDGTDHPTVGMDARFVDQPTVSLPSGLAIPKLGFGTWQLEGDTARRMVSAALEAGFRHIDTAQMYGNEGDVGRALSDSGIDRSDVFVTTKVDNDRHEPHDLVASVEESLELLDTDHVDLLLLHWPTHWDRVAATLSTMAQVQASGLAQHIGVSNFTIDQLREVSDFAPIEVLQVECHPYLQQQALRSWCVDHGWAFTAYSPIARGEVADDETIARIAEAHDADPAAITLAWLLSKPQVTAIPKTTSEEHLGSNLAALTIELTDDEIARIDLLDERRRLVDPDSAPWNS
jgi:2,5-diketo-D-gluconate reductase B